MTELDSESAPIQTVLKKTSKRLFHTPNYHPSVSKSFKRFMPRFQLEVAILLVLGAIFSLAFLYLRDSKEGQIKLPEYADDGYGHGEQLDPFDVTKQEDLIDGHPLDAHGFWVKVRSRLEFDA